MKKTNKKIHAIALAVVMALAGSLVIHAAAADFDGVVNVGNDALPAPNNTYHLNGGGSTPPTPTPTPTPTPRPTNPPVQIGCRCLRAGFNLCGIWTWRTGCIRNVAGNCICRM